MNEHWIVSNAFTSSPSNNVQLWTPVSFSSKKNPAFLSHRRQKKQQQRHSSLFMGGGNGSGGDGVDGNDTEEKTTATTTTTTTTISIESIVNELQEHKSTFDIKMSNATTTSDIEQIRIEYLGKKGPINAIMGYMRNLSPEDKPKLGSVVNTIKNELELTINEQKLLLEQNEINNAMKDDAIDVTMPGLSPLGDIGRRHPLSMTMEKAVDIFVRLGYDTVTSCADSPEIETDYYCFEALNCPKDHPARDMQDTFYLTEDMSMLLRTHTSSVQIRQLEKRKPPLRIVAPGRVYRRDDIDATHSMIFHQVEILAVEERGNLNLGHLKGTIEHFLQNMFGPDIEVRFRGSYFPFTEPSMEVDVFFRGKWLEVLGCGMVDPNVLEMAGVDPTKYSGFAAGFGVERFAMVIHGISDIREFYKNDKRFLQQFPHFYDLGLPSMLRGEGPEPPVEDTRGEYPPGMEPAVEDDGNTKKQQKQQKKQQKQQQNTAGSTTTEIDISKLDIRVGIITKAWEHEEADKLFCEEIDIGEENPRQIASGLRAYYNVDELIGKKVLVLTNLKSRKLVGFPSHGMVLCASKKDDGDDDGDGSDSVEFVLPPEDASIGERVMVDGFDGEPATENQVIKKKMLDIIFPLLKTDSNGIATYKGIPLTVGPEKQSCRAENGMSDAQVS